MRLYVLIMDDHISRSRTLEQVLLLNEPNLQITYARSLDEGLALLHSSPDIILLDIGMQGVDGASAIGNIKSKTTAPVMEIANTSVQEATKAVNALSVGAVDYVRRQGSYQEFAQTILQKINVITENLTVEKQKEMSKKKHNLESTIEKTKIAQKRKAEKLVIIGASTGGPRALQRLFQDLPTDFNAPILIVQHMPSGFTKSLAERLNRFSTIDVKEAEDGEFIQEGKAYIAPGNYHLCVKANQYETKLQVELQQGKDHLLHRPSVDVLFESVARLHHVAKIAVILTGMGKDGQEGIKKLKQMDDETVVIAESSETAIINGMPKAATETNLVTEVVRLDQIGKALGNMM